MQRCSESIGTHSAALAKAQAEIINPEKSLTATIRSPFSRVGDQTFRYAPLSTGNVDSAQSARSAESQLDNGRD